MDTKRFLPAIAATLMTLALATPTVADTNCANSNACANSGRCTLKNGRCLVGSDDDCRRSKKCREFGQCSRTNDFGCKAANDDQSRQAKVCRQNGRCTAQYGSCHTKSQDDCDRASICNDEGRCTYHYGTCVVGSDDDCRKSTQCKTEKKCKKMGTYHCGDPDATRPGAGNLTAQNVLGAGGTSAHDCRINIRCVRHGLCSVKDGVCVVGSDDDCKRATDCGMWGLCRRKDDRSCRAASDEDCAGSQVCSKSGMCKAVEGSCEAPSAETCRTSRGCTQSGICTFRYGVCIVGSDADCRATEGCKQRQRCYRTWSRVCGTDRTRRNRRTCVTRPECLQRGLCSRRLGRCHARDNADCRLSEACVEFGRCTALDGKCVVGRDRDCRMTSACTERGLCRRKDDQTCQALAVADRRGLSGPKAGGPNGPNGGASVNRATGKTPRPAGLAPTMGRGRPVRAADVLKMYRQLPDDQFGQMTRDQRCQANALYHLALAWAEVQAVTRAADYSSRVHNSTFGLHTPRGKPEAGAAMRAAAGVNAYRAAGRTALLYLDRWLAKRRGARSASNSWRNTDRQARRLRTELKLLARQQKRIHNALKRRKRQVTAHLRRAAASVKGIGDPKLRAAVWDGYLGHELLAIHTFLGRRLAHDYFARHFFLDRLKRAMKRARFTPAEAKRVLPPAQVTVVGPNKTILVPWVSDKGAAYYLRKIDVAPSSIGLPCRPGTPCKGSQAVVSRGKNKHPLYKHSFHWRWIAPGDRIKVSAP